MKGEQLPSHGGVGKAQLQSSPQNKCMGDTLQTHRLETHPPAYHSVTSVRAKEIDFIFRMAAMSSFQRALRSP